MTDVLIVDDEPQLVRALQITLGAHGYSVRAARDAGGALRAAASRPPDLILLDLGLPDQDGMEVIRGLRGWCSAPVIVLSGRGEAVTKVAALDAGADDYVTKPFGMSELLARMRAVARRVLPVEAAAQVVVGGFLVDLAARQVSAVEDPSIHVRLTPTEWRLLERLVTHPGRLVTGRQLLTEVWGPGYVGESAYLRVFMAQLRRKLEPVPSRPRHLITEPGIGYRFEP